MPLSLSKYRKTYPEYDYIITLDIERKCFRIEKPGKPVQENANEMYNYGAANFGAGLHRMNDILNEAEKRQSKLRATLNLQDPPKGNNFPAWRLLIKVFVSQCAVLDDGGVSL